MNKSKHRHQPKSAQKPGAGPLANSSTEQLTPNLQDLIDLALQHHSAGRFPEAESIYKQILKAHPDHPDALHLLGVIAHQVNKNDIAVDFISKALAIDPNFAEAHNNLGSALQALEQLDEAVASYRNAIAIKPNYTEAHNNLAGALRALGRLDEAVASYRKLIAIEPDYAEAHINLGVALQTLGHLDEAVASYRKALIIKPDHTGAHCNLAIALNHQGNTDEAVQLLQTALEKHPGNTQFTDCLIGILNYKTPNAEVRGGFAKAQEALQQVTLKDTGTPMIADETVHQLYQQCNTILDSYGVSGLTSNTQLFRGAIIDLGCVRHMKVFDTFNIIPEYCFGCYKISIETQTVSNLIKLMVVFDNLELPNDNTRKCHIEVRPEISGTYKGLIYCHSLEEAQELAKVIQTIVAEKISKDIPVSVKRGCSEYPIAYPEFGHMGTNGTPMMSYNEEWREKEEYIDKNFVEHIYPPVSDTHNHAGLTLHDALVMRTWLAYAAAIEDLSYLKVSGSPVPKLQVDGRPLLRPSGHQ